jgi:ATP-dependent helicase Lhr and Lhr-like helicase
VDEVAIRTAVEEGADASPDITDEVLDGLKFSAALPRDIALAVLAERMTDPATAAAVGRAPMRILRT